jgi:NAD(P)-dependent dehydrogenase (short-subunit alcohol dehydrogenase family)
LGFNLVVNYRADQQAAESACADAARWGSPRAIAIPADIADLEQGQRLVNETLEAFGRVDLWINNAGVAPEQRLDLLDATPESWDRVLAVNLRGPFFLTLAVARVMINLCEAGTVSEPQIVFISSISSRFASITRGDYCVAKAGLSMAVSLFAARLAGLGIRVYEIRPGLIGTDMTHPVRKVYDAKIADGMIPIPRWGTPADVGRAVAAIASGFFPYSTGAVLDVDGGLNLRIL